MKYAISSSYEEDSLRKSFLLLDLQLLSLKYSVFYDRKLNNKIKRLHKKALRIAYKENDPTFKNLLETDSSVTIHQKNLQLLLVEIYKQSLI